MHFCLNEIALDKETGTIDFDRVSTGISSTQRAKISRIREIIIELSDDSDKIIPVEKVYEIAGKKGFEETECDEIMSKLKRTGDIFEPKRGYIQKI